jgi:hypothetical protein
LRQPALELRLAVVAPEGLAVDLEEGRAEDARGDGRVAGRLQARLPDGVAPRRLGRVGVDPALRNQKSTGAAVFMRAR